MRRGAWRPGTRSHQRRDPPKEGSRHGTETRPGRPDRAEKGAWGRSFLNSMLTKRRGKSLLTEADCPRGGHRAIEAQHARCRTPAFTSRTREHARAVTGGSTRSGSNRRCGRRRRTRSSSKHVILFKAPVGDSSVLIAPRSDCSTFLLLQLLESLESARRCDRVEVIALR